MIKIAYLSSGYVSHARVAEDYRAIIRRFAVLVHGPEYADIVLLHDEPHLYQEYFWKFPVLRERYVIAYAVWEASSLPNAYKNGIRLVQEVWTCSRYCQTRFAEYHCNVVLIPHVAERGTTRTPEDVAFISSLVRYSESCLYMLAIGRLSDGRKNLPGLIKSFAATRKELPTARLILKVTARCRVDELIGVDERIIVIPQQLSNEQMHALYKISDVYISPHRGEGWGLCISDALASGCLVVATRYSGPADYLTEANCIEIPYKVQRIKRTQEYLYFDRSMKWAEPDMDALTRILKDLGNTHKSAQNQTKRDRATQVGKQFSVKTVSAAIKARLVRIKHDLDRKRRRSDH